MTPLSGPASLCFALPALASAPMTDMSWVSSSPQACTSNSSTAQRIAVPRAPAPLKSLAHRCILSPPPTTALTQNARKRKGRGLRGPACPATRRALAHALLA
jgi:hypothetical protein